MKVEDGWQPARLIPVFGIRGQQEQEKRATSVLLAVMHAVPEFAYSLLKELGAPRGRVHTFAEIQLKDGEGKVHIPDGAIVVERGAKRWCALVEVKTGGAVLEPLQVSRYLDMARDNAFDAVVTVSNQLTARPTDVPVVVDRRRTRRVALYHCSWWKIITEAVIQHRFRGIADPDQAWILGELIAYLDHENSGASGFQDMGPHWVAARESARQGTLRASDDAARSVAERWEQFLDYLALGLSQDLGREVQLVRPRRQELRERLEGFVKSLADTGTLSGAIRVPDAIAALTICADLRARQLTTSLTVEAPREGRPASRISWLVRQLTAAPADVRLTTAFQNARETTSALLSEARDAPHALLSLSQARRDPRSFELALARPLGLKGGKGQGSFIRETRRQLIEFYAEVVQGLKEWQPRAPKLPQPPTTIPDTAQEEPPPFSAIEGREIGEATTPTEPALEPQPEQPALQPWSTNSASDKAM